MIDLTLVLDIDETLVYTNIRENGQYPDVRIPYECVYMIGDPKNGTDALTYIRPGTMALLKYAKQIFNNVILFSAGTQDYVVEIARIFDIDPSTCYHREHCTIKDGRTVGKHLSVHGLDTVNTYYVDDLDMCKGCRYIKPGVNFTLIDPYNPYNDKIDQNTMKNLLITISKWAINRFSTTKVMAR